MYGIGIHTQFLYGWKFRLLIGLVILLARFLVCSLLRVHLYSFCNDVLECMYALDGEGEGALWRPNLCCWFVKFWEKQMEMRYLYLARCYVSQLKIEEKTEEEKTSSPYLIWRTCILFTFPLMMMMMMMVIRTLQHLLLSSSVTHFINE